MARQAFGGGGTSNDHFLTTAYATARLLRLADGPDEVHRDQLANFELKRHRNTDTSRTWGDAAVLEQANIRSDFAHLHTDGPGHLWA